MPILYRMLSSDIISSRRRNTNCRRVRSSGRTSHWWSFLARDCWERRQMLSWNGLLINSPPNGSSHNPMWEVLLKRSLRFHCSVQKSNAFDAHTLSGTKWAITSTSTMSADWDFTPWSRGQGREGILTGMSGLRAGAGFEMRGEFSSRARLRKLGTFGNYELSQHSICYYT